MIYSFKWVKYLGAIDTSAASPQISFDKNNWPRGEFFMCLPNRGAGKRRHERLCSHAMNKWSFQMKRASATSRIVSLY
jgi:hypothetical protein